MVLVFRESRSSPFFKNLQILGGFFISKYLRFKKNIFFSKKFAETKKVIIFVPRFEWDDKQSENRGERKRVRIEILKVEYINLR